MKFIILVMPVPNTHIAVDCLKCNLLDLVLHTRINVCVYRIRFDEMVEGQGGKKLFQGSLKCSLLKQTQTVL